MKSVAFSTHSSANVQRIFSQITCMKIRITNSLNTEIVRNTLLARLSSERIRYVPTDNQTKKANDKEWLKIHKHDLVTDSGSE